MTDEELMRTALDEAKIAADLGEVPVGAVRISSSSVILSPQCTKIAA